MPAGRGILDRRGVVWGLIGVAVTLAMAFLGSDRLVWFDATLVGYLFGVVFKVFGDVDRSCVWTRRPPTAATAGFVHHVLIRPRA